MNDNSHSSYENIGDLFIDSVQKKKRSTCISQTQGKKTNEHHQVKLCEKNDLNTWAVSVGYSGPDCKNKIDMGVQAKLFRKVYLNTFQKRQDCTKQKRSCKAETSRKDGLSCAVLCCFNLLCVNASST